MAKQPEEMPGRIWAWWFLPEKRDSVMQGGWTQEHDEREDCYVLSTPAREAADNLLDALRSIVRAYDGIGVTRSEVDADRAAIAKATGSDT